MSILDVDAWYCSVDAFWQAFGPLWEREHLATRRRRNLALAINRIRQTVVQVCALAYDPHCIIDSLQILVVQFFYVPQATPDWNATRATFGHCCVKKQAIFGYNQQQSAPATLYGLSPPHPDGHQPTHPPVPYRNQPRS